MNLFCSTSTVSPHLVIPVTIGEDKLLVQENKIYRVECNVPDGVPPVSNGKLSCGNITESTQPGNNLTLPVMFTRNMNGQNCTCTAQHVSRRYMNNTSVEQLNVTYQSNVKIFTLENSPSVVENLGTLTG
ncbi:hypothetical protein Btru_037746 [Bulinus truncatus]|nr:hypothetical protein Btru_037746 [Bulinus truncatus]